MIARVFHAINPNFGFVSPEYPNPVWPRDYRHVADIELGDISQRISDFKPICEELFRLTNHIDEEWSKNKEIKWAMPKSRSTSVGDIIEIDGMYWRVENVGFVSLT